MIPKSWRRYRPPINTCHSGRRPGGLLLPLPDLPRQIDRHGGIDLVGWLRWAQLPADQTFERRKSCAAHHHRTTK